MFVRGGGRGRGRRRWDFLKDFLVGGLQNIDLVHHLVLTGSDLIHGLRQRGETLLTGDREPVRTKAVALGCVRVPSIDNIGEALAIAESESFR